MPPLRVIWSSDDGADVDDDDDDDDDLYPFTLFLSLTHSHTMTPFDAPGKQAF